MSQYNQVLYSAFEDEMRKLAMSGKALAIGAGIAGTAVAAPYAKKRWDAGGKELEESRLGRMRKRLQQEEMKYQRKYQSGR